MGLFMQASDVKAALQAATLLLGVPSATRSQLFAAIGAVDAWSCAYLPTDQLVATSGAVPTQVVPTIPPGPDSARDTSSGNMIPLPRIIFPYGLTSFLAFALMVFW